MLSGMLFQARLAVSHVRFYNLALARQLPNSFANALAAEAPSEVSMDLARQQHAHYIHVLRQVVPVLQLEALPDYPDSVFVEDTIVACNKRQVILTQLGHKSRRGEVDSLIQTVLVPLGVEFMDMRQVEGAFCDGGDVLNTGRHVFVGISQRTNAAGAGVLQEALGDQVVVPVPLADIMPHMLHLKSAVTIMDAETLVVPTGPAGDALVEYLHQAIQPSKYSVIRLPNVLACNLVSVNGTLLVQDTPCVASRRALETAALERNLELVWVDTSELGKKDGALTCCSVLLDL